MGGPARKRFVFLGLAAALVAAHAAAQEPPQHPGIAKTLAALADAFNRHDPQALAALWATDAVHESAQSGDKLTGRDAIGKAYAELFKADPKAEMKLHAGAAKEEKPGELSAQALVEVRHGDGSVTSSHVAATLVESKDGWRIKHVRETVAPPRATDALAQLEWLVGSWVDESKAGRVVNDVDWARGRNFLTRAYRQENDGKVIREGTQIVGWDTEDQCLRCWTFDNDGSFGEGVWEPDGENRWVARMVLKLADGARGSMTQLIERLPDGNLKIESLAREIDGQSQPNSPAVTLRRADKPANKKS